MEQKQWLSLLAEIGKGRVLAHEVDFVADADEFATAWCFQVGFRDILALIVEKAMRVSSPGDTPHVDTMEWKVIILRNIAYSKEPRANPKDLTGDCDSSCGKMVLDGGVLRGDISSSCCINLSFIPWLKYNLD